MNEWLNCLQPATWATVRFWTDIDLIDRRAQTRRLRGNPRSRIGLANSARAPQLEAMESDRSGP
ncbi:MULTISPECIES: hypothetical protein [unclassified Variovorax]|uniref:hypothetical protein n=1 Tax=unclassified Variovorax TaxID=663243 RepID=UPI003ECC261E